MLLLGLGAGVLAARVAMGVEPARCPLGHQLEPTSMRITEFAPAIPPQNEPAAASSAPASGYGPPTTAARLGKLAASLAQTFLSNQMGRSGAQQGSRFTPMSGVEKPMAACAWSTRPAFAVVAPARCASSVNGMAPPPRSRSPRERPPASSGYRFRPPPMA